MCYIYCPRSLNNFDDVLELQGADGTMQKCNGMIIGEFVCDDAVKIKQVAITNEWEQWPLRPKSLNDHKSADETIAASLLTEEQLSSYLDDAAGFAWHISDLHIYERPKQLCELRKFGTGKDLEKPPRDWFYVTVG